MIYVADKTRIQIFDRSGKYIRTFLTDPEVNFPKGLFFDKDQNLFVVNAVAPIIRKFNQKGEQISSFGDQGQKTGEIGWGWGVLVDPWDRIFVSDTRLQMFDSNGNFLSILESAKWPRGLAINGSGDLIVGGFSHSQSCGRLDQNGKLLGTCGVMKGTRVRDIFIDSEDKMYITGGDSDVNEYGANGEFIRKVREYTFGAPMGIIGDDLNRYRLI